MLLETTRTGLPEIGEVPWGSHFCQFYETAEELADALVPFFKAGLENNEQCIWVTSEPLRADAAREALRAAMPDVDQRFRAGQIEILDFDAWYIRGGVIDIDAVLNDWVARKEQALAKGYQGLRVSGNTCWLETSDQWRTFAEYEAKVHACFHQHRIVALCSYHLGRCSGTNALDVVRNHQFAITCDDGAWNVVESAPLKSAREELRRANESLEARVAERTAQLREGERRFRDLLQALPAAVYTTDAAGRITYFNQAAVDLAGRRPTLGSDEWCVTWRLYRPDGTPMPHDQCPMAVALRENRPVRGEEAVAERPDGRRVSFIPYPTPLRDEAGTLVGAVNMLVDITERKQAEALAAGQKYALQMLGEGAPLEDVLSFVVLLAERHAGNGMLGSVLLLNQAGTHFERGIGPSLPGEFNASVAGVAVSSMIGVCCHAVANREPVVVSDFSADPQWAAFAEFVAPYDLRAGWSTPIIGSDGKVLGTFANYYRRPCDPTPSDLQWLEVVKRSAAIAIERRQAENALRASEERLRRLNQELAQRVQQEVAEREAAQRQLAHAQRMEALGQLAGGIAHDFNNVLQAIQGGGALIERRPADPEAVRRLARLITDAAGRGASVTRRLLAFARRDFLHAEPINAVELLTDTREILAHTLGGGIEVRLKIAPQLPLLMADRGQLETVLVNLATNARDAMPDGGILTLEAVAETVGHKKRTGRVQLALGVYVRLSVIDTGLGMDDATLARAAEPFFTTKPLGQGTGLGLAMASGFAAQSGGAFDIRSKPRRGTSAILWFPVAEQASMAARTVEEEAPPSCGETRARLLLVDDDGIVLETLAEEMEAAGYSVLTASSGQTALALLESGEAADLIISDMSMPGMGGVGLIQQAQQRRPGLPAILLTGFAGNAAEIAIGGAVSGMFSLLRKPVDGRQLAERVAALLEVSGTARAARRRAVV